MGCFFGCFGSSKHRKHKHKVQGNGSSSSKQVQPSVSLVQDCSKNAINPSPQLQDKTEEQLSVSSRKKVTFDSNVKTYEPVLVDEVEERKSEEGGKEEVLAKSKSSSSEDSSVTSTGSYPPNHRYQNCRDSDDEDEEIDYGDSDLSDGDDDDDDDGIREECNEVSEDFGEDGMVATTAADQVFAEEVVDVKSIGSNLNARDRSVYVHSVLNPVENLTQWKAVKTKRTPQLRPQKENEFDVKEPSFSLNSETDTSKKLNREIPVDASLSNWLISSETTPASKAFFAGTPDRSTTSQGSYSVLSHEDRPILGALTLEEIKQFSATSSPRKSPCRSPDEMPIIGTVGTYWNVAGSAEDSGSASSFKGIPNTTSKYREDKRVNWHSTPFETRLEKALNRSAASTYVPRVF
ncbi:Protein JASON, partial [Mucuna pruriens]